jgi:SAM-dependent methyltransferase
MDEETLKLLTDLHINNHRQGPGSKKAFHQMLELSGIDTSAVLSIVDIGCGTGSSTIPLLENTMARITAVELLPAFLEVLKHNAQSAGVEDRVHAIEADMAELPFEDELFDAIWSEGAIYNIGFENGLKNWKRFLKPKGIIVVSEITWLSPHIPEDLKKHWEQEYPEIATASKKINLLEENGYIPTGYFPLPVDCWLDNYYTPLETGFTDFLERNDHSELAKQIVEAEQKEIDLYRKYKDYYSYGVYIARKL